ncbi:MAG: uncharacterized protein A8A55_3174 [Amphiamblys sp. WSBS2006]|nr:MAG: uncharacterized protein A8A55_3174 [Amphiamblys sp. WSBS2006]
MALLSFPRRGTPNTSRLNPTDCLGFLCVEKSLGETEWIVLGCIVLEVLCWVREATETIQECSQCQNSGWGSKRGHVSFQTAQTLGFCLVLLGTVSPGVDAEGAVKQSGDGDTGKGRSLCPVHRKEVGRWKHKHFAVIPRVLECLCCEG